jgi:hypothetical protein
MKLLVFTFSTNDWNPGFKHLLNSLRRQHYDFRVAINTPDFKTYDEHGNYYPAKARWLKENARDYTHFLFTDAWDTIALGPEGELIEKYKHAGADKWIYSAEQNSYPHVEWAGLYPKCNSRWKYLNAGGYICPVELFITTIEKEMNGRQIDGGEWGSKYFLFKDKGKSIQLDTK